jgi:hypothetical protein
MFIAIVIIFTLAWWMGRPAKADGSGGGDSYSFRGGVNFTEGAGEGQVAVMGPNTKVKWVNPSQMPRADYNVHPVVFRSQTGYVAWSMPEQGAGYKKVILVFSNYTNSLPFVVNFPVPFDRSAVVTSTNIAGTNLSTLDTSTFIMPPESVPVSGAIVIEGI